MVFFWRMGKTHAARLGTHTLLHALPLGIPNIANPFSWHIDFDCVCCDRGPGTLRTRALRTRCGQDPKNEARPQMLFSCLVCQSRQPSSTKRVQCVNTMPDYFMTHLMLFHPRCTEGGHLSALHDPAGRISAGSSGSWQLGTGMS